MNNKILHINSYYFSSSVHSELVRELSNLGISQDIYIPLKKGDNKNEDLQLNNVCFYINNTYSTIDRLLYYSKISKTYNNLKEILQSNKQYSIIHAHSLFINGGLALKVKRDFNIDYVVAVRATDIHLFMKYFKHLRKLCIDILLNASKIFVLNDGHRKQIIEYTQNDERIKNKLYTVTNGIDKFWHNNKYLVPKKNSDIVKLLFVGKYIKRKNIFTILKTLKGMKNKDCFHLTLIGDGPLKSKIKEYIEKNNLSKNITLLSSLNKSELIKYYRDSDIFINIAFRETFGLVYIEALSQNCFIIYTKNEGVDGLIPSDYGMGIDPYDIVQLENSLNNYNKNILVDKEFLKQFDWKNIAKYYMTKYQEVIDGI